MPKVPIVQEYLGKEVSKALRQKIGAEVHIGQVDVRLPDRLIVDDVLIYDQSHKEMLRAGRIAAGIEILPLLEGKIRITSAQLFTTQVTLYKKDADAPLNCQFVIDSLKSKDTTSHTPLDLAIESLVIRHSSVKYDRYDMPKDRLTAHIAVRELSSNIILNSLTDDAVDVEIGHVSFDEKSGLSVKELKGHVKASKSNIDIKNLSILLPHSNIKLNAFVTPIDKEKGKGVVDLKATVTPSDIEFLDPHLSKLTKPIDVALRASGSMKKLKTTLRATQSDGAFYILATATGYDVLHNMHGNVYVRKAAFSQKLFTTLSSLGLKIPKQVTMLGNINLEGMLQMKDSTTYRGKAEIAMNNAGKATVDVTYHNNSLKADIKTPGLALDKISGESRLGEIICDLSIGIDNLSKIRQGIGAKGHITEVTYNKYTYHDINLDAIMKGDDVRGKIDINDPNAVVRANGSGNLKTKNIDFADIDIKNLSLKKLNITDALGEKTITAHAMIGPKKVSLESDIADVNIEGRINPFALKNNAFTVSSNIKDGALLSHLLKTEVKIPEGIHIDGDVNTNIRKADVSLAVPDLSINGNRILKTNLNLSIGNSNEGRGVLVTIPNSSFDVAENTWTISAKKIYYNAGTLSIDEFSVGNGKQNLYVNGNLSKNPNDSIVADVNNVDIRYVLDMVDFHSVDFDGTASGHFIAHNLLGNISAKGHIDVEQFQFEHGNLGVMHIDAAYNNTTKIIDIKAVADDPHSIEAGGAPIDSKTFVNGVIIPSPGSLNLNIEAQNSRMEFMQSFCSTFMKEANLHGSGSLRLYGPFSNINLEGKLVASGAFTLSPTNCRYTLTNDTVTFIPDDILLQDIPLYDRYGNYAIIHGGIHHKHLTRLSYDINATTTKLLAYDFPVLKDQETFCGHAIINGDVGIHGRGNELVITADATPLQGSYLTYNAASSTSVHTGEIITWRSASRDTTTTNNTSSNMSQAVDAGNDRTNVHMNMQIHATPEAKLHLIMDPISGDFIDLFGNGDLRAEYYNKGGLNIFGNYEVSSGTYKMTLQNILRRDFTFQKGGNISFGGDPYDAIINMNALYKLNSVSLSDLNIGSNFSTTNVPVNCIMNITGTPGKPKVAFGVELPTLSLDARQMVNSVINSEEEMNQQVLYLLAIGRFYAPSAAMASSSTTSTNEISQSTLAIQSFLSGTLSQSFNNMMSNVMSGLMRSGNNLSFGANIAPGNEGFNNAEYEGLLSGNFFNNRLLFSGQFGYRDRAVTNTSSFIGDFSLQYILTKNGVISLKAYNQSNDRYFTKNALNTQGIGVVFQTEWGK